MKLEAMQFKLNAPRDLMEKIKNLAERESRSVTAQVNLMLRKQVEAEQADQK